MPIRCSLIRFFVALFGATSLAFGQGYSDSTRNYHYQLEKYKDSKQQESKRADAILQESLAKHQGTSTTATQSSEGASSFATKAAGVAAVVWTLALLQEIFVGDRSAAGTRAPVGAHLDPSVERWLQDPRNRVGEPYRFDTPDGQIAKVCIRPFRGTQTVVYRWDAPNEVARATDIAETPTGEHIQFTHPSARGLFIYVTTPAPNHQPSDKVFWLASHRIGMTGCGHAQAYQIVYPKYGGAPEFESVARPPRIQRDEPTDNLSAFVRTCQAHHGQTACLCLASAENVTIAQGGLHTAALKDLIPGFIARDYNHDEVRAALQRHPGLAADVTRRCKVRL